MTILQYMVMLVIDAFAMGFVFGVVAMKMKRCKTENGDYNIFKIRR